MNETNQCPKCNNYIFGTYCCTCNQDIRSIIIPNGDNPFKDLFGDIFKEKIK